MDTNLGFYGLIDWGMQSSGDAWGQLFNSAPLLNSSLALSNVRKKCI